VSAFMVEDKTINRVVTWHRDKIWEWWTPREEDAVLEGDSRAMYAHFHSWCETWQIAEENGEEISKEGWFPQLSIGQMLAFLKDHTVLKEGQVFTFQSIFWNDLRQEWIVRFVAEKGYGIREFNDSDEPCDALFTAVK
jgi:hypothetical protein